MSDSPIIASGKAWWNANGDDIYNNNVGNVGIGTTAPERNLDVRGTSQVKRAGSIGPANQFLVTEDPVSGGALGNLWFGGSVAGSEVFYQGAYVRGLQGPDWDIGVSQPTNLLFATTGENGTAPTERMRIDSAGNVGIGTTAPLTRTQITYDGASQPYEPTLIGFGTAISPLVDTFAMQTNTPSTTDLNAALMCFQDLGGGTQSNVLGRFGLARTGNASSAFVWQFRSGGDSVERMRIDSAGNVGIGINTPNYPLDVRGNDAIIAVDPNNAFPRIFLQDDLGATRDLELTFVQSGVGVGRVRYATDKSMQFQTQSAERMRLDSTGNMFIGTTANPPTSTTGGWVFQPEGRCNAGVVDNGATKVTHFRFYSSGAARGTISSNNAQTFYETTSDYRMKENIVPLDGAMEAVSRLKPSIFNFITARDTTSQGFIAHELAEIVPEAVSGEKDGEEMQGVDLSKLVPLLTAAIQELHAEVEALKNA